MMLHIYIYICFSQQKNNYIEQERRKFKCKMPKRQGQKGKKGKKGLQILNQFHDLISIRE